MHRAQCLPTVRVLCASSLLSSQERSAYGGGSQSETFLDKPSRQSSWSFAPTCFHLAWVIDVPLGISFYSTTSSHFLKQWFSKCGPWTKNISITWEVRDATSQALPWTTESETLGLGPNNLCLNKPYRWFWGRLKFENIGLRMPNSR